MFLTVTLLIAGHLHFTQPTHVATLHPQSGPTVQLHPNTIKEVPLKPAQPTIVKTWSVR